MQPAREIIFDTHTLWAMGCIIAALLVLLVDWIAKQPKRPPGDPPIIPPILPPPF